MSTHYNIALLAGHPEQYVQTAQQHFAAHAQRYLLGEKSLPHITICQYIGAEDVVLSELGHLCNKEGIPPIQVTGLRFKYKPPFWWPGLMIARTPELMSFHLEVVRLLHTHGIKPLNSSGDLYTPHITLAQVDRVSVHDFSSDILKPSPFALVLGESDDIGQLTRVLHTF